MTNGEKIEKMLTSFNGSRTLKDLLFEMAEWKEKEILDCAVDAYCEFCDTKECEDYDCGECDWKLKFEKKLLKNLKK